MFYGCGYFGNNFEIVILINRYFKIIWVFKICILFIEVRYLKKKMKMLLYLICCDSKEYGW